MRERNLAVSENICNFVLGKSSIFVSMIFVSVFDVCVAQNRVNGTFNTVGYVANKPYIQCVIPIEGYLDYLSIWDTEGSDE